MLARVSRTPALWRVVPLVRQLARVVRLLPRLQLVNGVADEVSNAEAEWAFATCGQLLKCGVTRRPGRLRPAHGKWRLPCGWRVLGRRAWQGAAFCEGGRLAVWCRLARENSGPGSWLPPRRGMTLNAHRSGSCGPTVSSRSTNSAIVAAFALALNGESRENAGGRRTRGDIRGDQPSGDDGR